MTGICRPVSKEAVRSPSAAARPPSPQGGGSGSIGRGLNSMSAARLPPKSATTKIRCLRASLREPAQYWASMSRQHTSGVPPRTIPAFPHFPEQEFLQQFGFERNEMMRIGIVIPDKKTDQSSDEEKFYHQMMKQIAMNLIDDCNKGITITDGEDHLIIVFFSGYGEEKFDTSSEAEELMDILRNECNAEPKLVFGSEVSGFKNLQVSYNDALYVVKSERKEIADVFYSKTDSKRNDIFQEVFREFKQACILNCSNIEQVMHILKRFKRAVESYNLGRKYAINCYFELASAIYFSYINETGNTPEESLNSFTQSLVGTDKEKAEEVTEMFLQKILAKEEGDEHEIIRKVKNMIHEDLSQDLTVANLAAQLYVSPNYLSRLFKQITGEGCNEYIVRKRIEKAKSLLETTSLKTGEIAMMVGYHDMNYFSLAFKKHIGKAPTKYRNIVQKQERSDS